MSEHSKALATPVTFQYGGKTWNLSPWNYGIIGEYEVYLQDTAIRTCRRFSKYHSDEQMALLMSKTRKDIDTGVYTFGSDEVKETFNSYVHFSYMIYLCLRDNHPEVTYELAREMVKEVSELLQEKIMEANSDPNQKTQPLS